jgi:hypothetical protein
VLERCEEKGKWIWDLGCMDGARKLTNYEENHRKFGFRKKRAYFTKFSPRRLVTVTGLDNTHQRSKTLIQIGDDSANVGKSKQYYVGSTIFVRLL